MKNYFFAVFIIWLTAISCNHPRSIRPGVYASSHYSIADKVRMAMLYNEPRISTESDLQVNDDSTFKYLSYGLLYSGTWRQQGDSLMLFITNVESPPAGTVQVFNNLSRIPDSPIAFRITGSRLEQSSRNGVKVLEFALDRDDL